MKNTYILETGAKGRERLETVQFLYGKDSKDLLNSIGLKEGMIVMDAGCGIGSMTKWIHEKVGSNGRVKAVDNNRKQLELMAKELNPSMLNNLEVICKDIHQLTRSQLNDIDIFYSRLLLVHNKEPARVLNKIKKYCKKGAFFVLEEPITSDSCCFPDSSAFDKHLDLYVTLANRRGFDFNVGEKIPGLVKGENLQILGINYIKKMFIDEQAKMIAFLRTKECYEKYLEENLATADELDCLLKELHDLAINPEYLLSGICMVQVWGLIT